MAAFEPPPRAVSQEDAASLEDASPTDGDDADSVSAVSGNTSRPSMQATSVTGSMSKYSAFTAPSSYRNSGAFVHGTKFKNFKSIMEHGLKAAESEIWLIDEVRANGRVPGLQASPDLLIFIDENKARSQNMEFDYNAGKGSWRTVGLDGVIRPWFFQKVVDIRPRSRGNVLFQSKEDPVMMANAIKGPMRPKKLIHATYWENVYGIQRAGIIPARNPKNADRRPFKDLLQGAEAHVYTVNPAAFTGSRRPSMDATDKQTLEIDAPVHLDGSDIGLERVPDAFFEIDFEKAEKLGIKLEMVQSSDRMDTVFVKGVVPSELLTEVVANDPVNLPEDLKAKIVDPKSFEEVPIIDISGDEKTVVEQLRYACEVVGFMQIVGHGVDPELLQTQEDVQKGFFALPQEIKDRLKLNAQSPVRGYFGRGGEDLDNVLAKRVDVAAGKKLTGQARKDNKEALDMNGVSWSEPVGGYVARIFGQASRLPTEEELPGFECVMAKYNDEMFKLAKKLLRLMALVLGQPEDLFEEHLTRPVATSRILHYWPITDFKKQIGVGEHTDYGLLTLLKQDPTGGLQVLNAKDEKWVHAVPIPDAFVVNIGDMLERWSNHRFKSTIHRVINTSPSDRYSAPYFIEPNMESLIVPGAVLGLEGTDDKAKTSEEILGNFYRASGQLKDYPEATDASSIGIEDQGMADTPGPFVGDMAEVRTGDTPMEDSHAVNSSSDKDKISE